MCGEDCIRKLTRMRTVTLATARLMRALGKPHNPAFQLTEWQAVRGTATPRSVRACIGGAFVAREKGLEFAITQFPADT